MELSRIDAVIFVSIFREFFRQEFSKEMSEAGTCTLYLMYKNPRLISSSLFSLILAIDFVYSSFNK